MELEEADLARIDELVKQARREIERAEAEARRGADAFVRKSFRSGLDIAEDDLERSFTMDVRALEELKKTNYNLISGFSLDQQKETERILRRGVMNGWGTRRIADDISRSFKTSTWRARTIARTEVLRAANRGRLNGWKQSGLVKRKEWLTAFDDRTCSTCADLDGQIVSVEKMFQGVWQEVTTKIQMPPIHPNCRCTAAPIITKEAERQIDPDIYVQMGRWDEENFPTTRQIERMYGNMIETAFREGKNRVRELIFRARHWID